MSTPTHKINECSCPKCQAMCKNPCIGTPMDMIKIHGAGFGDRLAKTGWAVGKIVGTHKNIVEIIAPLYDEDKKACTFFTNGLCELHDLGLKPTEGKFADCKDRTLYDEKTIFGTPLYACIKLWEITQNNKN